MQWTVFLVRNKYLEHDAVSAKSALNAHNVKRELILFRLDGFIQDDARSLDDSDARSMAYQVRKAKHKLWVADLRRFEAGDPIFRRRPQHDDYETAMHLRGHPPIVRYDLEESPK